MTRGGKVLTLFLFECALLGGAFGGGYYKQRQLTEECHAGRAAQDKLHRTMQAWQQVMGAAVGAMAGNYGYAVERTATASATAAAAGLRLEKDFAEINNLLVTQSPLSRERLLALADKLMPGSLGPLGQPGSKLLLNGGAPAPAAAAALGTGAATGPSAAQSTGDGKAPPATAAAVPAEPATGTVPAGGDAAAKAPQQAPAAPVAAPAAAGPKDPAPGADKPGVADSAQRGGAPSIDGHRALLEAKVSLLSGADQAVTLRQIALAQTLLDDAGRTELDDLLGAAMKALREKDEAHARSAIEAALAKLRAP